MLMSPWFGVWRGQLSGVSSSHGLGVAVWSEFASVVNKSCCCHTSELEWSAQVMCGRLHLPIEDIEHSITFVFQLAFK